jgi:IS5 family transposase
MAWASNSIRCCRWSVMSCGRPGTASFHGKTRTQGKILSLFEPATEVIRKGKLGKPNQFGNMVKLQEAENQIVIDYEVYNRRPSDADLLIPAIEVHQAKLGRPQRLVAADAAFYSAKNDAAAKAMGVKRVCIPNRSSKSRERKREQKKRWFRNGQKWRTGCEGRISVVKRRHSRSLPLQRLRRNEPLGWSRHHRRQVVNIGRAIENNQGSRRSVPATARRSLRPALPYGFQLTDDPKPQFCAGKASADYS